MGDDLLMCLTVVDVAPTVFEGEVLEHSVTEWFRHDVDLTCVFRLWKAYRWVLEIACAFGPPQTRLISILAGYL